MTRDECLTTAAQLVTGDRAAAYGDLRPMHDRIASIWSALLGHPVSPEQVAIMLAGLKLARVAHDPTHKDSWVDAAGYIALGAELAVGK